MDKDKSGPELTKGLNAKCTQCGHSGTLWIDDETFAHLVANAAEKSESFKGTLLFAGMAVKLAERLEALAEACFEADQKDEQVDGGEIDAAWELIDEWKAIPKPKVEEKNG